MVKSPYTFIIILTFLCLSDLSATNGETTCDDFLASPLLANGQYCECQDDFSMEWPGGGFSLSDCKSQCSMASSPIRSFLVKQESSLRSYVVCNCDGFEANVQGLGTESELCSNECGRNICDYIAPTCTVKELSCTTGPTPPSPTPPSPTPPTSDASNDRKLYHRFFSSLVFMGTMVF